MFGKDGSQVRGLLLERGSEQGLERPAWQSWEGTQSVALKTLEVMTHVVTCRTRHGRWYNPDPLPVSTLVIGFGRSRQVFVCYYCQDLGNTYIHV